MQAKTLRADDVRARERKQKIRTILWWLPSFFLHLFFIGLVGYFGYQKLVEERTKEEAEKPPADLDEEVYEALAENIESVRFNELLKQLQDLQIILHNMDVLKNEFAKTFDDFAAAEAEQAQKDDLVQQLFDRTLAFQGEAIGDQAKVAAAAPALAEKMKVAEADPAASQTAMKADLNASFYPAYDRIQVNQADAQNTLDRIVNEAKLIGLSQTAEKTEEVRELQLKASQKQRETHQNLEGNVWNLSRFPEAAKRLDDHGKRREKALEDKEKFKAELAKHEAEAARLREAEKEDAKALTAATKEADAANRDLEKAREALEKLNAKLAEVERKKAEAEAKAKAEAEKKAESEKEAAQ